MAHGKITDRWTCDFMYDFYNGGMLLEVYTDYRILSGLTARIGEFKVPYTIEKELSPTTVELINCYSQSVCYLAGVSGSDKCYGCLLYTSTKIRLRPSYFPFTEPSAEMDISCNTVSYTHLDVYKRQGNK